MTGAERCEHCDDELPHVPHLSPLWVRMAHLEHCVGLGAFQLEVPPSSRPPGRRAPP